MINVNATNLSIFFICFLIGYVFFRLTLRRILDNAKENGFDIVFLESQEKDTNNTKINRTHHKEHTKNIDRKWGRYDTSNNRYRICNLCKNTLSINAFYRNGPGLWKWKCKRCALKVSRLKRYGLKVPTSYIPH